MIFNSESFLNIRFGRFILAAGLLFFPRLIPMAAADSITSDVPNRMSLLDRERLIRIGNRLTYTVEEDRERPLALLVNPRGEVDIPLLGKVDAVGKTCQQLAYDIKSLLEVDFYYRATVLVDYPQFTDNLGEITMLGEVLHPGPLPLPADDILTVSAAVNAAGGFKSGADAEKVTLIRDNPESEDGEDRIEIDVNQMFTTGNFDDDMELKDGDYILVPKLAQAGGQFYIWGEVKNPGNYDIPIEKDFTVSKAIFQAGGFGQYANRKRVVLIKADPNLPEGERMVEVNVQAILEDGLRSLDPAVEPDDIIRVKERRFMIQ